ncbi:putative repeat protein (TIGR03843 family) [Haloactinopolyspora alba]|uniref:Putative repeat protein (TIGR03843 family) n=1 Tax=Haloactinopolyspora alba TaxID=648780 RepID=A0A2P8D9E4_9ACTN|nr:SCO1664 family protein [Haloactinopolyspora alba]PSK93817.1 putative repeat protein (TIGR03843 family) [Haloactinopolyspora alba]
MDVLSLLRDGELSVEGRLVVASNLTLLGRVTHGEHSARCVYKPVDGERPLWDFPDGSLAAREVAAYELSEAAGWHVVPPTVLREDGPFGPGMCQLWIDQPEDERRWVDVVSPDAVARGWLPVLEAVDGDGEPVVLVHADDPALRRMAVFDAVVNNADRKGGHVLAGLPGADRTAPVVGVDHGVCFHVEPKLRTVLWGWAGTELTPADVAELTALRSALDGDLDHTVRALLSTDEVTATAERVDRLLGDGRLPDPTGRMPVPWPVF